MTDLDVEVWVAVANLSGTPAGPLLLAHMASEAFVWVAAEHWMRSEVVNLHARNGATVSITPMVTAQLGGVASAWWRFSAGRWERMP